jgi:hypothetical protein
VDAYTFVYFFIMAKCKAYLVKLARLRRPKITCSPLYADCTPKTNAAILWDRSHTKGRLCKGGIGQGKETRNLNEADVLTLQE